MEWSSCGAVGEFIFKEDGPCSLHFLLQLTPNTWFHFYSPFHGKWIDIFFLQKNVSILQTDIISSCYSIALSENILYSGMRKEPEPLHCFIRDGMAWHDIILSWLWLTVHLVSTQIIFLQAMGIQSSKFWWNRKKGRREKEFWWVPFPLITPLYCSLREIDSEFGSVSSYQNHIITTYHVISVSLYLANTRLSSYLYPHTLGHTTPSHTHSALLRKTRKYFFCN